MKEVLVQKISETQAEEEILTETRILQILTQQLLLQRQLPLQQIPEVQLIQMLVPLLLQQEIPVQVVLAAQILQHQTQEVPETMTQETVPVQEIPAAEGDKNV